MQDEQWERRMAEAWTEIDALGEEAFRARIDALTAELGPGSPVGLFERGAAFDSTGHSDRAAPLYAQALEAGLDGERRRRAVIQMSSSLRNLGEAQEALRLLTEEAQAGSDHLDGAVATFRALALADLGREREGLAVALTALSAYLPRYNASAARYAQALLDDDAYAGRRGDQLGSPAMAEGQKYRMRTPSTGRETFVEAQPGRVYTDRDTGEKLQVTGRVLPLAPSPSQLPWAVENLRFCSWCDQLAQRDLNDCPTCGRRMAPLAS